jgi:membrane fusion protein, peptide pheromone/bacteriocin exporter
MEQFKLEDSIDYYLHDRSSKGHTIYLAVLIFLLLVIVSLFIVKVNISVQGSGYIRPIAEKTEIQAFASEMVDSIFVHENQHVEKNNVLLKLNTLDIDAKLKYYQTQKKENEDYIHDLLILTQNKKVDVALLKSLIFKQGYFEYEQQMRELSNKKEIAEKAYIRYKQLYEKNFVAEKEYDDYRSAYNTASNSYRLETESQMSKWQSSLKEYRQALSEIESNIAQVLKEKNYYIIKSPVSGTVEQFSGIFQGSHLQSGQTIAVISPDSTMIAEVYVSPQNIGYISKQSPVRIQVDAFNYNEWGILSGKITEISSDYVLVDSTPMFKIRCVVDRTWLSLKNNVRGNLKKGMTIRARFLVTKRSLFQLLYQDIDDWINPVQYSSATKTL